MCADRFSSYFLRHHASTLPLLPRKKTSPYIIGFWFINRIQLLERYRRVRYLSTNQLLLPRKRSGLGLYCSVQYRTTPTAVTVSRHKFIVLRDYSYRNGVSTDFIFGAKDLFSGFRNGGNSLSVSS